jgi:hypothetical protein
MRRAKNFAKVAHVCRSGLRFVRGTARYRTWRERERRPLDWVFPLPEKGVHGSNHGRSIDRRDAWVRLNPTARLGAPRGHRRRGSKKTNRTTHRSEGRSSLKANLRGLVLFEMSDNPTTCEFSPDSRIPTTTRPGITSSLESASAPRAWERKYPAIQARTA